ncbi:MAG: APC family permease [Bacillota bacterium]|nr:APC family permease [Bacillota bacterium]
MQKNMEKQKEKYGLFTAITMIVGICIGSGIFFKSDNVLSFTGGNVGLGVLLFILGAIAVIFGGLTIAFLAAKTNEPGGLVTYAEKFVGKPASCAAGWFLTFIYMPSLSIVVAWVVGIYTCVLFPQLGNTLETQLLIGYAFLIICFIYNTLSPKFGGFFQDATTIIKLIPLIVLAVCGIIFGDANQGLENANTAAVAAGTGTAWLAGIAPIAFSYDGWIVSTSICHEVRNSKRNMPIALIAGPLFVLVMYLLYFLGITHYLGPQQVMALGDKAPTTVAASLFSPIVANILTVFVIISVMGTVNGVVLGLLRMPYSLSLRQGMMPFSKSLSKLNKKVDMPINSALFAFVVTAIWGFLHYWTQKKGLLGSGDVTDISIALSYVLYVVLYVKVIMMFFKKEADFFRGLVCPIFATLGSAVILYGNLSNPNFKYYLLICIAVLALAVIYYLSNYKKASQVK